jgi:hypothetical protein
MNTYPNKYQAEQAVRSNPTLKVAPIFEAQGIKWATIAEAQAEPLLAAVRAKIGPMKIELRNVQFAAFMSEETNAFTATIYVNGKKAGEASNQGHGGSTDVQPHSLAETLDAYGATLPRHVSTLKDDSDPTGFFTQQPDAEHIVDNLFEQWLEAREAAKERKKFERDLTTRILFTKKGAKGVFQTKKLTPVQMDFYKTKGAAAFKDCDVVLNLLPADAAWTLWQAQITRKFV